MAKRSKHAFDAVSLGILWDRLISITDEIVSTLVLSSFSTIVSESYDLSCVVLDAEANSIAQGTMSVPIFIASAPVMLARIHQRRFCSVILGSFMEVSLWPASRLIAEPIADIES